LTRRWIDGINRSTDCLDNHGRTDFYCHGMDRYTHDGSLSNTDFDDKNTETSTVKKMSIMADLLFGNETSIGQVSSYADALEDESSGVDDLPGYCCLDVPIDTKYWGEQVRSTKFTLTL
jgi:hypothetical protein